MSFDPVASANGVWVGVSIIVFALVFQHIFVPTLVDGFRDSLFGLRRELFLLVARGDVSATDRSYLHFRDDLNRFIRFAERMTFTRCVLVPTAAMLLNHRLKGEALRHHAQFVENIADEKVRQTIRSIDDRMAKAIAIHVLASSPVAWVLTVVALPIAAIAAIVSGGIGAVEDHVVTKVSDRAKCEVELLAAA